MFLINAASYLLRSPQIATLSAVAFNSFATQNEKKKIMAVAAMAFVGGLAYGAFLPPPLMQRGNSEFYMLTWVAANATRFAIEGMSVIANIGLLKLVYDRLYGR